MFALVGMTIATSFLLLIPISIGIAMLRYRLWDIDRLANRALVYGALTLVVIGIYVLTVAAVDALVPGEGTTLISLAATGLIALVCQPIRVRLQRGVNRLLYGERDDPYVVLSRLGQRLSGTLTYDAVLPTIVETVAQALKLPYAAIALWQQEQLVVAASYGTPISEPLAWPLTYQQESVGALLLAPRATGEAFGSADRRLLDDLARHVGVAVHDVRLTADLQRSRERLVNAREEERRRLRRDLHDGLGPQLASQTLTLDAARKLMPSDPATADALLDNLRGHIQTAVEDVRRLVYALRPPALDDLGLVAALHEGVRDYSHAGLAIGIEAPASLPPLPAAVEVAAYRIVQEALTNVVRHAEATTCIVTFVLDVSRGILQLEIADDGCGMPQKYLPGVGLISMRERATELGGHLTIEPRLSGGTLVRAELPLQEAA
jgi:signal transduction histidine kinase